MRFGPLPLAQAEGTVLAHTHRLPSRVLRKGQVLDAAAVAALREAGVLEVIAAAYELGDLSEDISAGRLADLMLAPGIGRGRAATGRVNLVAETAGLLRVDASVVDRINAVDESVTLGTLPDYAIVGPREIVATIKVIPFAVPERVLAQAEAAARATPALSLHPFRSLTVGLVSTTLPGLKPTVLDATEAATEARVTGLTGRLLPPLRCPHDAAAIAQALRTLEAQGAEALLVAGASATVDRRDVGPDGIVRAGGEILHFGMPVDPGNLICLGGLREKPALVLPGCARSPRLNGIDFVLSRLFAGVALDGAAIARMGVGGLLKEGPSRPLPRERAAPTKAAMKERAPRLPSVGAIVLAAGRSSRMAPHNKLLIPDRGGKPMVARVVDNLLSSAARPVLVVTGHASAAVADALGGRPVRLVDAPDYADGLSASLRAGLSALPEEVGAALICLGDMPLVTGRMINRLIEAYDPDEGRLIVVPTFRGKQGNPVLWDRRFFAEMAALTGDAGARQLLPRHLDDVAETEIGEDAVLRDFDTVESLDSLPPRLRPPTQPAEG
ncbi:MAG TPA: molybdopterin-binding/glycosyltransferase family 2 protein [Acidisphaera sp.]|nr:molybdopterin-binding/glycosyltransferase family 2 protein [Acidisphaera sp.]